MNQINGTVIAQIKAAAAAAAEAAKGVAPKGTKMPVAQWTKRNQFEVDGTKHLRELLDAGYVVSSIGKPTTTKGGEVGVNFKIAAPQCGLEAKVEAHVKTQLNSQAKRKAKREAAAKAKEAAAPAAPVTDATAALLALGNLLPVAKAA